MSNLPFFASGIMFSRALKATSNSGSKYQEILCEIRVVILKKVKIVVYLVV